MKTKLIKLHKHYQEKTNELGEMLGKADVAFRDSVKDSPSETVDVLIKKSNDFIRSQIKLGYTEYGLLRQFTRDLENLIREPA